MKTVKFSSYHEKDNIPMHNTKILLAELYNYSPEKFFKFLNLFMPQNKLSLSPKLTFSEYSSPTLMVSQPSFKITFETKLNNMFTLPLLKTRLNVFNDEDYQILATISTSKLHPSIKDEFYSIIDKYNDETGSHIIHADLTYSGIIENLSSLISKEESFFDIILDYQIFCISENLICRPYPQ